MSHPLGVELAERLHARLTEIERSISVRIEALPGPQGGDPEYLLGLRGSVQIALGYALHTLEHGEREASPPPAALLEQARKAARNQISLDTVLRRYLAGHALLLDLVIEEATAARSPHDALQEILGTQAVLLDRLLAAVAEAYSDESESLRRASSTGARRLRTVERLLAGEPLRAPGLRYELDGWHTALIVSGPGAKSALEDAAAALDRALLAAWPEEATAWAWLGGRSPLLAGDVLAELSPRGGLELNVAVGEAAEGIHGWRQSHQQARAAWPIAGLGPDPAVRYADVALLASILQDGLLLDSLRRLYLEPLDVERDRGTTLRETLRAYFAAERSAASAAAALGVSRQTVNSRLRTAEQRIGRPLGSCGAELEAALRTEELSDGTLARGPVPRTDPLSLPSGKQPIRGFVASQMSRPQGAGSIAPDAEKQPGLSLGKEFAK